MSEVTGETKNAIAAVELLGCGLVENATKVQAQCYARAHCTKLAASQSTAKRAMDTDGTVKKILVLAANPKRTERLRLDQEARDIAEGLERSQQRDLFRLEQRWAVRHRDIQRSLLDINPQIVHFSGHGSGEDGLIFEDEGGEAQLVNGNALAGLFELFAETVECVLLNGCYSDVQAKAIAQHIPCVIGMSQSVGDRAAIEFAVGFYDALGAGRSFDFAYKLGCSAIRLAGSDDALVPVMIQTNRSAQPDVPQQMPPSSTLSPAARDLSAGARHRLGTKQKEIQNQLNMLNEEIQYLQSRQRTDDLSPREGFRLKKQIEEAEAERDLLTEELTTLEQQLQ